MEVPQKKFIDTKKSPQNSKRRITIVKKGPKKKKGSTPNVRNDRMERVNLPVLSYISKCNT